MPVTEPSLPELEAQRDRLHAQPAAGDFRRESVSENYRKCGKPNHHLRGPDHPASAPVPVHPGQRAAGGRSAASSRRRWWRRCAVNWPACGVRGDRRADRGGLSYPQIGVHSRHSHTPPRQSTSDCPPAPAAPPGTERQAGHLHDRFRSSENAERACLCSVSSWGRPDLAEAGSQAGTEPRACQPACRRMTPRRAGCPNRNPCRPGRYWTRKLRLRTGPG